MIEKWNSVTIYCWNFLKGVQGGISANVEITKDRYCDSDCENTACPLNKTKEKGA